MAGCLILRHDEEMGDLSKSQFAPAAGGPFVNAVLCLLQNLIYARWINLLSVQEDFPIKHLA